MSKLKFYFHPEALTDIEDAMEYYQGISVDLPTKFFVEVQQYIDTIRLHPKIFKKQYDCRRVTLPSFPYIMYYRLQSDYIEILGIFHGYKKPSQTQKSVITRKKK